MQDVLGIAQNVLHMALSNAAFAGVAALLVWGFSRLCRKPALIHALWLVVLLKLLTPPIWNFPIHLAIHAKPHAQPLTVAIESKAIAVPASDSQKSEPTHVDDAVGQLLQDVPNGLQASSETQIEPATSAPVASSLPVPIRTARHFDWARKVDWAKLQPAGAALWAMGTTLCLLLAALRIARFHRMLRFATRADWELQDEADRLARKMGMRSSPRIWLISGTVCPMLWAAWGRPRVLVPRELWCRFDAQQRRTLLVHELAHCVRRDHWVRYLELLATAVYWWNPLCWWARRHLREAEEQCCDAWVMAMMPGSFKQYAHALLEAVDWISAPLGGGSRPGSVPALASGMGQFTDLKRRLTMLKQGNVSQSVGFGGAAATIALAASLLPVMPTFAQTATPPAAPQGQPAYVYEVVPDQVSADALPETTAAPVMVAPGAAGPAIVSVRRATTSQVAPSAAAEYQLAVASADANQAWTEVSDGRQLELAKAQAEVAALQAQLNVATVRLKQLQMQVSQPGAMNGNFNFNQNGQGRQQGQGSFPQSGYEIRQLPDGKGGMIYITPDKKIVARIDARIVGQAAPNPPTPANPFQFQPGQPMQPPQPMPRFGGAGMPAMPGGGGGMAKFGTGFARAGAQFKADAAREDRMRKIESQLSQLMKSVAELRQEIQHEGNERPTPDLAR